MVIWRHTPLLPTYIKIHQKLPFLATKQDSPLATAEARVIVDIPTPTSTLSSIARNEDQKIGRGGFQLDHDNTQLQDSKTYMEGMLDWSRPNRQGHWPPYEDYVDRKYDPNRWEEFDQ